MGLDTSQSPSQYVQAFPDNIPEKIFASSLSSSFVAVPGKQTEQADAASPRLSRHGTGRVTGLCLTCTSVSQPRSCELRALYSNALSSNVPM
ncbi:hypothetical protein DPEC_G00140640 [Dallia pectoralis]|uniref:Uncharacterized protein n=1 Tax=Dallia pectoralis TaxID=75939 RepID=A0ACC2GN51_DALPE|nr:hypothetical protein DPEC_G00140640 [Dallia pectoralis]